MERKEVFSIHEMAKDFYNGMTSKVIEKAQIEDLLELLRKYDSYDTLTGSQMNVVNHAVTIFFYYEISDRLEEYSSIYLRRIIKNNRGRFDVKK